MSTSSSTQSIRLEAVDVYFGASACRSLEFAADVGGATNNAVVDINYISEEGVEVLGYVYFNSSGAGADPAPAGKTLIAEVATLDNDSGEDRATAFIAALDGLPTKPLLIYSVDSANSALVNVDNAYPGSITAEAQDAAAAVTESELRSGFGGLLGRTKDAVVADIQTITFTVTSNQTGELALDEILQGSNVTISTSFLDLSQSNKEVLIGNGVGDIVVDGANNIVGIGISRLFQNVSDIGGRLILHPIRLARTDRSADIACWSTLAKPTELNFDGTDTQALGVEFKLVLDQGRNDAVNLITFGSEWISNAILA